MSLEPRALRICFALLVSLTFGPWMHGAAARPAWRQQPLADQDPRPLPDPGPFQAEVRKHLRSDRLLLSQYTFVEKRQEIEVSKLGKVSNGPIKAFEVYPSLEAGQTYRRLIAVNGVPVGRQELEKQDREHQKRVLERMRTLQREGTGEREKRLHKQAEEEREEQKVIDDLFRIYDIHLVRREIIDGHAAILVTFAPRPDVKPTTDDGKILKKVRGRAWVSEEDHEIMRVEAEAIEDLAVGLGVVGKLYRGSTASFERRKVNNEIWLPAEARFTGNGRLLLRRFHVDTRTEYSDYKKFTVDTATTFTIPK